MARIIAGLTTSHVPSITTAIRQNLTQDPKWKPFFDAFIPVRKWLGEAKPDVVVVIYQDHGLNFFLDKLPTFAIGVANEYHNADEGWGPPRPRSFKGDAELSWHIAESLIDDEFDMVTCQEMALDHALTTAGDLMWPNREWPVTLVPVNLNIVLHPMPKPRRCYKLGQAIGKAIRSYPKDQKVLVVASGGLSHQISQHGYINTEFDHKCMDKIVNDPESLLDLTNMDIVELAGSQGLEFVTWLTMRGAVAGPVEVPVQTYHAPLSHTGGAVMLLDAQHQYAAVAAE